MGKAPRIRKPVPFGFVLDELAPCEPFTRPMFGCTSIYVGERIVLILREKEEHAQDNGVWLATTSEHHASLKRDFPSMRSISLFGGDGPTGWQVLPAQSPDFESAVLKACALVRRGDPRIGKVPKPRKPAAARRRRRAKIS